MTVSPRVAPDRGERLLVLSRDGELIQTLHLVAFPNKVHAVPREPDLVASLLDHQAAIVLIDTAAVARSIARITHRLKLQFPELVLIVAGGPSDQSALAAQIARGNVYRFLAKPVSPQRIRLFLDAALRHSGQQTTRPDVAFSPQLTRTAAEHTGHRRNGWLVLTIITVAGLTGWLAFLKLHPPAGTAPAWAQTSQMGGAGSDGSLDSVLARGDAALAGDQLDAAAELYREAQHIDPSDPRVMQGVHHVMDALLAAANDQLRQGHLGQAEQLTRQAWTLEPDSQQVAQLLTQLAAAREQSTAPVAAAPAPPSKPAPEARVAGRSRRAEKVEEYLRLAHERMQQGNVLDPPDGSARYFVALARALAPADPAVRRAQRQLLAQVTVGAENAITANDPDAAQRWITAATELGARPDEVESLIREAQLQREATNATALDRTAALFNERMRQGRILDPANDCAKFYLALLLRNDPNSPSAQLARQLFQARTLSEVQDAIRDQDYTRARRWLAEAQSANVDAFSLAAIERDIQSAQAAAKPAPTPQVHLQLAHFVEPHYPLRTVGPQLTPVEINGTVNVQLTVNTDGTTTDVKVISADPPGVFDHAAVAAVRRWRYLPPVADGHPVKVRTEVRLVFKPSPAE